MVQRLPIGLKYSFLFLRLALAVSFLSAVADRFGLWGAPGAPGVAWGDFASFEKYTAVLNWFAPPAVIPALAWTATALEVVLAVLLVLGVQLRNVAFASAGLLAIFFVTMAAAIGIKAPLDYSVLTAAAAALTLAFASDN